jgi:uncharacterized repeat protein (TIGR03847 family)
VSSYELDPLDLFTAGTVGPPGQRVFYLQFVAAGEVATLKVEKGQVAALAAYLAQLLSDLPAPAADDIPAQGDLDLVEPFDVAWTVGELAVAYDDENDAFIVRADEIQTVDPDDDDDEDDDDDILGAGTDDIGGVARVSVTRAQAHGFIVRAAELMAGSRPPCPLCGRPIDPAGHMCIKTNGHAKG